MSKARTKTNPGATGVAGGVLSGTYPNPGFASDMSTQAELDAVSAAKQSTSEKGQPSGYASLDGSGKVTTTELPALAITSATVVASQAAMLALTAQEGDVAVRTDFTPRIAYILAAADPTILGNWIALNPATTVTSVNGVTGDVTGIVTTADSRLTDSRTPTGAAGGVLGGTYPNPAFAIDMATQAELDAVAANATTPFAPAKAVATGGITNPPNGGITLQGYTVVTGDRVVVVSATAAINGIWVVNTAGNWTRATDCVTAADCPKGRRIWIEPTVSGTGGQWLTVNNPTNVAPGVVGNLFGSSLTVVGNRGLFSDPYEKIGLSFSSKGALQAGGSVAFDYLSGKRQSVEVTVGTNGQVLTADSSQSSGLLWATPTVSSSMLAAVDYAAGSDGDTYTTTSGTMADIDATNLAITFTAPANGIVEVQANAILYSNGALDSQVFLGLRESSTDLANSSRLMNYYFGSLGRFTYMHRITGLTPGSSHTYKLAWKRGSGTGTPTIQTGPNNGPVHLRVFAAV